MSAMRPLKARLQPILQPQQVGRRPVGGEDDLLVVFVEIIEGMEELLLGGLLAGDKLDIVHQEEVGIAVFVAEFRVFALLKRLNRLVGELIALDVDDVVVRVAVVDLPGDGVEEVGFAKAAP